MSYPELPLPQIDQARTPTTEDILSADERRRRYREKLQVRQEGRGFRLKQFLQEKRRYFRTLDELARRKRVEDIDMMCRYYNGDQYGSYDAWGVYTDRRQEGDFAYTLPVLSGHADQAFLQLLKVKPSYLITPDDKNDATMKLVANMSEEIGVKELNRVMGLKTHSEIYNLVLGGESHRFIGWEPHPVSPKIVKKPKYRTETYELPARRQCANCGYEVPPNVAKCPECGSTNITDSPAATGQRQILDGYNEVKLGENCAHIPYLMAMQRDMSAIEPEDSTFVIEYGYIDKHSGEWIYQSEIEPSSLGLPVEMLLRFDLERGSNQTDAIIGTSRLAAPGREGSFGMGANSSSAPFRKQPHERHYWDAAEYGQFVCDVDETLPDGTVLPKGTILGDKFPDGARILFVGDTVMEFKDYMRRKKMTLCRYGRIAGTNAGAGLKKGMALQDASNDDFNLSQTVKHTVGHPLTVIDGHFISELPGAGNVLKVTRAGLDDVGKVVKQFPGQSVNQGNAGQETIQSAMQFIMGTNTVGGGSIGGAPDMRAAGTATGIAAMQEQAADRQSGPVDQRIGCDKEMIIQLLENIQEYSADEQKAELAKRFGPDVAKAFFECNLRQSVTVETKPNSEMPRSMALTVANYIAFSNAVSQILPEAQGHPWIMEFLGGLATSMGFPFSVGEGRNDRREAEYRLNVLTDIEQQLTAQGDQKLLTDSLALGRAMHDQLAKRCAPLIATDESEDSPEAAGSDTGIPRVFMQVHDSFLDVYKDALFGEKAKSWSEGHKLVVIQLWIDHFKAQQSQKAVMAQLMASMQQAMNPQPSTPDPLTKLTESINYKDAPPDIKRQMEEAAGMQPSTASEEDDSAAAEHKRELEMKGAEHDAGQQAEDANLERELIKQTHQGEIDKEIEKAKPRPVPASTNGKKR